VMGVSGGYAWQKYQPSGCGVLRLLFHFVTVLPSG
jgi:hypothetical protein